VIVSVLRVPVRRGAEEELARAFADLQVFERSRQSGGFLGGRLLRPLSPGEPFLVIAEWKDAEAYQGWLDNPVREQLAASLAHLVDGDVPTGALYEDAK
jgi:heme-degrading monooxygenase HmoA